MICAMTFKMVREILRLSFLLVVLLHFHTNPHYFLSASDSQHLYSGHYVIPSNVNGSGTDYRTSQNYIYLVEGLKEHSRVSSSDFASQVNSKHDLILMETKLLQLLEMAERPKPARDKVHVPKFIMEIYNNQMDLEVPTSHLNLPGRFTRNANTVRSFYSAGTEIDLPGLDAHLRYDLSSIPTAEEITGAELHVPLTIEKVSGNPSFQILVHDVVKLSSKSPDSTPITYPVDSKLIRTSTYPNSSQMWVTFDVFPAISRLLHYKKPSKPLSSLGLALQLVPRSSQPSNKYESRFSISTDLSSDRPILHTYSDDGKNPKKHWTGPTLSRHYRSLRKKRGRRNHFRHKNRRRNLCSRKRMYVDFGNVGWNDWIVAPPGYQAFFCSGECPFPMAEHLNATNHAVIQALVNSMNPRLVPPPCCVPNKYSSLSLLYTDSSDRIVLKNYNQMIVDSCGCN